MHPTSEALMNALVPAEGAVTTDLTDEIYDLLEPLHEVLDKVEGHLQEIDRLRRAADREETDPKIFGWFEQIKQTIAGARDRSRQAKQALEAITDVCYQLDNYANHMKETITRKETVREANPTIQITKVEHDHLKAVATEANEKLNQALTELATLKDVGHGKN